MSLGPLIIDVAGTTLTAEDRCLLAKPAVGGVILFTRNFESRQQLADLTADIKKTRDELIVMADYEGGRVQRFRDGFSVIPPMAELGRLYTRSASEALQAAGDLGYLVASELAAVGIDLPLAPIADRDYGQSTVIGHRAFSSAPETIALLADAYSRGLAEGGSLATAKHFPGHGWVAADSHAELPMDERSEAELASDWHPFAELIAGGVASIMMAHVRYPAIDNAPASLSRTWIMNVLRKRLGFAGCVFCDDLSMGGAAETFGDVAARVQAALAAGCDFLPLCNDRDAAWQAVAGVAAWRDTGQAYRDVFAARLCATRAAAQVEPERLARARDTARRLQPA